MQRGSGKPRLVLVVIFFLLTGCASEIGGYSTFDGSPTEATRLNVEQDRQTYLVELSEKLIAVPKNKLTDPEKTELLDLFEKWEKVDSVVGPPTPSSSQEIRRIIDHAAIELELFARKNPEHYELTRALRMSFQPFIDGFGSFQAFEYAPSLSMDKAREGFETQSEFKTGREAFKLLEQAIYQF
ncbi:MAG: hypothetical protein OES20_14345 [Gammaproteobacteria bacterium]|nr:hypothetical protein [Gammaproteobacteria bacterium]MDH3857819.1 hypothetical protein [Gammaproteobacteria bacterium]